MNIVSTQMDIEEECYDIFVSGCSGRCKDCFNKELWNFNQGSLFSTWFEFIEDEIYFADYLASKGGINIRYIRILGGEPLEQDIRDLSTLIEFLESTFTKELILFTSYDLKDVPKDLKRKFSYIKTGKYEEGYEHIDQYGFKILSNQKLNKRGIDY